MYQRKTLSTNQKDKLHVHITMLDNHPGIIARDLTLLMLASQLATNALTPDVRTEIITTLAFTFAGTVMPPYCAER